MSTASARVDVISRQRWSSRAGVMRVTGQVLQLPHAVTGRDLMPYVTFLGRKAACRGIAGGRVSLRKRRPSQTPKSVLPTTLWSAVQLSTHGCAANDRLEEESH